MSVLVDVHTTVSLNSIRYFDYMRANYRALAGTPARVRFFAYCLDRASAIWLRRDRSLAEVVALPYGRGSSGHALAIETALQRGARDSVNIIADSDTAIFAHDWDAMIVDDLVTLRRHGIVGTRLEDIGGFSSGETPYQQYKGKPTTTWMALSPHYDFRALQVRPDKANTIPVTDERLATIYNLPIGCIVVKDTGWQIPEFLDRHAIPHFAFDLVKPNSATAGPLAGTSPYHDEFHWNGAPFLAHQRGSMKHRFRIDPLSRDFYDACDAYFGAPDWTVRPNAFDRLMAQAEDAARAAKRLVLGRKPSGSGAS